MINGRIATGNTHGYVATTDKDSIFKVEELPAPGTDTKSQV